MSGVGSSKQREPLERSDIYVPHRDGFVAMKTETDISDDVESRAEELRNALLVAPDATAERINAFVEAARSEADLKAEVARLNAALAHAELRIQKNWDRANRYRAAMRELLAAEAEAGE